MDLNRTVALPRRRAVSPCSRRGTVSARCLTFAPALRAWPVVFYRVLGGAQEGPSPGRESPAREGAGGMHMQPTASSELTHVRRLGGV